MNNNQPPPEKQECECHCVCNKDRMQRGKTLQLNCQHCQPHQDEGMEWEESFEDLGTSIWVDLKIANKLEPETANRKMRELRDFIKILLAKDRIDTARKIAWAAGQAGLSPRDLANPRNWIEAVAKDRQQLRERIEKMKYTEDQGIDAEMESANEAYDSILAILEGEDK